MEETSAANEPPTKVKVHIDRTPDESPNPTTGEALHRLGRVPPDRRLYREVQGDREDELIPNGHDVIQLRPDDHFYSAVAHEHGITIVVNARKKTVHTRKLTFEQLVALAFDPVPTGPNWEFTVTYRNGPHSHPQGTLLSGQSVRIHEGMIFNVTATDKS